MLPTQVVDTPDNFTADEKARIRLTIAAGEGDTAILSTIDVETRAGSQVTVVTPDSDILLSAGQAVRL